MKLICFGVPGGGLVDISISPEISGGMIDMISVHQLVIFYIYESLSISGIWMP